MHKALSKFSQNSIEALLFLTLTGLSRAKRPVPNLSASLDLDLQDTIHQSFSYDGIRHA